MENLETPVLIQENQATSLPVSVTEVTPEQAAKAEKAQLKALLAEARNTREMLEDFNSAVLTGTYTGGQMLKIAKGLAFMDAILKQNKAHLENLQERIK